MIEPSELAKVAMMRRATEADLNFIVSGWVRSYRGASWQYLEIPSNIYWDAEEAKIKRVLQNSLTWILTSKDDPAQYFGFICFVCAAESNILHYVYVKKAFRSFGFATKMIEDHLRMPDRQCTYLTRNFAGIHKKMEFTYNPYLIV
jgi:GNAT superfamily N-acetyltransferase